MPIEGKKVIAVLPAYNAAKTLKATLDDIPQDSVDDIILVDDASKDNTVEVAKQLGLKTIVHEKNLGYGGNQKTCYREALRQDADIAIMIHPDHQYDPKLVPEMIMPIVRGEADAVFGSRMMIKKDALEGGMPYWKYTGNIILTAIENFVLGTRLTEFHSGYRAYGRESLQNLPLHLNSDDFVFDTEIIVQLVAKKYRIKEIPIPTRYFKDASSISVWPSIRYALSIFRTLARYKLHQWGIKKSEQFKA